MEDNSPEKILEDLKLNLDSFKDISNFSPKVGIYAIGVTTAIKEFTLISAEVFIEPNKIIYIGKTEKSQISRDLKTHFENGKSGSSTVRRSLGAILIKHLNLTPMPRNSNKDDKKRFTNYKFTDKGEERLTEWMRNNLSLSYWEWDESSDLGEMEKEIIKHASPILNLQSNPLNKWKSKIKELRKTCRNLAKDYKMSELVISEKL